MRTTVRSGGEKSPRSTGIFDFTGVENIDIDVDGSILLGPCTRLIAYLVQSAHAFIDALIQAVFESFPPSFPLQEPITGVDLNERTKQGLPVKFCVMFKCHVNRAQSAYSMQAQ